MPYRVLVTREIPEPGISILRKNCEVKVSPHDRGLSPDELVQMAKGRDGLLTMLSDAIGPRVLDACPTVRAVSNYAVGFNNIDIAECTKRGIGVSNTPGVLTDATAETAWTLILAAARRVVEGESLVRSGQWNGWGPMQCVGVGVSGKVLGIVGAGRIGRRVGEMARGFGMKILYTARTPKPAFGSHTGAQLVSLEQLLRESDVISIHTPLTPETRHLIGARQFAMMKATAVLVNTARGPVVDEAALIEALHSRQIFAAGLDVYEDEPALTPGLRELPNAVLLPHIGSATIETRAKMAAMAAESLITMLEGRRPEFAVNEVW